MGCVAWEANGWEKWGQQNLWITFQERSPIYVHEKQFKELGFRFGASLPMWLPYSYTSMPILFTTKQDPISILQPVLCPPIWVIGFWTLYPCLDEGKERSKKKKYF